MDLFLLQKITIARLQQRCVPLDSGHLLFRMRDGRGAAYLTVEQWNILGDRYRERIMPSARLLSWAIWLQIPLAILALFLLIRIPGFEALGDLLDRFIPGLFVILLTTWPLMLGAVWHYRAVMRATAELESFLATRERVPEPQLPSRLGLNLLEIAAIVLVGPHLIVGLYGTLVPDAYDHTPFTGTQLGPWDIAAFATLIGLLILRSRPKALVSDPVQNEPRPVKSFGRAPPRG